MKILDGKATKLLAGGACATAIVWGTVDLGAGIHYWVWVQPRTVKAQQEQERNAVAAGTQREYRRCLDESEKKYGRADDDGCWTLYH